MDQPDRLIADEHFDRVVELHAWAYVDVLVVELQLQELLQFDDLWVVHCLCPADLVEPAI
ncbi:hypothetical protein FQZ97_1071240 [compost metagenome]